MVTIEASPSSYKEGIQCSNPFEDGGSIREVEASSGDGGELFKFMLLSSSLRGVSFRLNDTSCDEMGVWGNKEDWNSHALMCASFPTSN